MQSCNIFTKTKGLNEDANVDIGKVIGIMVRRETHCMRHVHEQMMNDEMRPRAAKRPRGQPKRVKLRVP